MSYSTKLSRLPLCIFTGIFLLTIKVENIEYNSVLVATPNEGGEVEFCKRGVILTHIIHWLGPPLFLPWCSTAVQAVYSGRFAKGPCQGSTLPAVSLELAID